MKFQKFAPLTKIEEQEDGTLHVFGLVTAETPDLDNEVCDYATTKPLYQKRTVERFNFTSKIAGMTRPRAVWEVSAANDRNDDHGNPRTGR